ncbi:PREDICTED: uncharacterized acetyltransferase At3g50280-like [Fragaria vesca subsp. vesca]
MGLRQRLKPPLPNEYFGNALQAGIAVKSTAGELLQNGIGWGRWAALHINKMIASFTSDDARKRAENFVKSPTFPYPTDIGQTRSTPVLLIAGSSPRFNVYGNDFGWGRQLCVRDGPAGKKNGMLKVYLGDEEGKIDFSVCLLHETLQAMAGVPKQIRRKEGKEGVEDEIQKSSFESQPTSMEH